MHDDDKGLKIRRDDDPSYAVVAQRIRETDRRNEELYLAIKEIRVEIKAIHMQLSEIQMQQSRREGFLAGAGVGVKAGSMLVIVAIAGVMVTMYSVLTGKVNPMDFFK